ncbi:dGTPase [Shewanella intestini]|uniref:Probable deoxyguanosinetriphosphate triphosphohydrolase n=1 Tax=Shewanella intestini TaxID=2017544 RepID=A0ABS5I4X9_9GAMM|nr:MULTISPECIES: dGTPase [Shewanella]MBR9728425.1 dGTPase [Shewanella intestini]MRG36767.1 dGTPase [Shewanella sp. XMDDZSB0408]
MSIHFKNKIKADRPFQYKAPISAVGRQFESDRGRIINSAAIRRLQQKTQVFPLERNAAVRSRLTHSMEVQQVGRYISQLICDELKKTASKTDDLGLIEFDRELETLVEMSCLMHDVGNPPFGHFGEAALIDWLETNLNKIYLQAHQQDLPKDIERDLISFEGNAQGIRLIHTLLKLNLTYSQASGIMKYTRCGTEVKPEKGSDDPHSYLKKKVGYYLSETDYITELQNTLAIEPHCRSPFSYIMEAADDISYGIADLEDAVEKGVLTVEQMKLALIAKFAELASHLPEEQHDVMKKMLDRATSSAQGNDNSFFVFLRVGVNFRLPQHAQKRFIDNIEAVYHGHFNQALIEDNSVNHMVVETFKQVALEQAFCHPEVEARELQGYRVISGLMQCYQPLLALTQAQFNVLVYGVRTHEDKAISIPIYPKRLFKKLSSKHLTAYQLAMENNQLTEQISDESCREFYFRTRLLIDYISGMTDQFAYDEYRAFHVIADF